MNRSIVVLGGSGFVGRALVEGLLAQGDRVRVLSRSADTRARIPAGADIQIGDVFEAAFLRDAFRGTDVVINLVGILNERGDDGSGFRKVYVELAETMLAAMKNVGVLFTPSFSPSALSDCTRSAVAGSAIAASYAPMSSPRSWANPRNTSGVSSGCSPHCACVSNRRRYMSSKRCEMKMTETPLSLSFWVIR